MPIPTPKVEIGFDLTEAPFSPFFTLDSATQGRLDNTEYTLGGVLFIDVTDFVKTIDISRGKTSQFTTFPAGQCDVGLNNHLRTFDPLYDLSPYAGNIVPRREIRVSSNGTVTFLGWIEDWDLDYQPDGDSVAVAKAYDTSYLFANQILAEHTPSEELTGARINSVLDRAEIGWPAVSRDIDPGTINMGTATVAAETNALNYLQNIAQSDPGYVFITRDGKFAFRDRRKAPTTSTLVEFGTGGIPIDSVQVVYGSEELYNDITLSRKDGSTVIALDTASINEYGARALTITNMQMANDADLVDIALGFASQFSQPEYRFEAINLSLQNKSVAVQNQVLGLEIGDVCKVSFTPNNIGPAIVRYVEVIRIEHQVDTLAHLVTLGFQETRYAPIVLDDAVFGKLDVGTLSW